jgi:predicted DNA-binding protein
MRNNTKSFRLSEGTSNAINRLSKSHASTEVFLKEACKAYESKNNNFTLRVRGVEEELQKIIADMETAKNADNLKILKPQNHLKGVLAKLQKHEF